MRIYWIMPDAPTRREIEILKEIHGEDIAILHFQPVDMIIKNSDGRGVDVLATKESILKNFSDGFVYAGGNQLIYFEFVGMEDRAGDGNFWKDVVQMPDGSLDVSMVLHLDRQNGRKVAWKNPRILEGRKKLSEREEPTTS